MAAFPVFIELEGKSVLVAGAGRVAKRKVATLLDFGAKIHVVAKEVSEEFREALGEKPNVTIYSGELPQIKEKIDTNDYEMVIAATDSEETNREIASLCKARGILVNTASGRAENSFYFPAVAKNDDYIIGISTDGKSPGMAKEMRIKIEKEFLK